MTSPDKVNLTDISMPIKMPDVESWRIPFIYDIINSIGSELDLNNDELYQILWHVCTS